MTKKWQELTTKLQDDGLLTTIWLWTDFTLRVRVRDLDRYNFDPTSWHQPKLLGRIGSSLGHHWHPVYFENFCQGIGANQGSCEWIGGWKCPNSYLVKKPDLSGAIGNIWSPYYNFPEVPISRSIEYIKLSLPHVPIPNFFWVLWGLVSTGQKMSRKTDFQ